MIRDSFGAALRVGVVVSILWAAVEARGISRRPVAPPTVADPSVVEASYRSVEEARRAGKTEEALLALRERAEKGPYPGFAWFLLGELAFAEKAFGAAVHNYRRAVDLDPSVTDRVSAFAAGRTLSDRVGFLARAPWAGGQPPELADLRYLQRRLSGGCE